MENGFLYQVAKNCCGRLGKGISDFCFVFPNRRSSVFFRKYLGEMLSGAMFSPKLLTVDDFFKDLSGLRPADRVLSLYLLYGHYRSISKSDESFDRFVNWGDVLLNDFDDVDKYMADAGKLFTNIRDLKQLDSGYDFLSDEQRGAIRQFWSDFLAGYDAGAPEGGSAKKRFQMIWEVLYPLYTAFRDDLRGRGLGYAGMIYRDVAEDASHGGERIVSFMKGMKGVVFVGLNALNSCQTVLLDFFHDGKCPGVETDFYWDFYGRMMTDPANRSSSLMSRNVERYPSRHPLDVSLLSPGKDPEIHLVAVPSGVGQATKAYEILDELNRDGSVCENTAVVLSDETMLDPMLNSIPESIVDVNVTMGQPMRDSNVFSFMNAVCSLQVGKKLDGDACSYSYRDVMSVLDNILFPESSCLSGFRRSLVARNILFPSGHMIIGAFEDEKCAHAAELVPLIFRPVRESRDAGAYLMEILDSLEKDLVPADREYAYMYYTSVVRLNSLHIEMELKTFFKLLFALTSSVSVSYRGEPLRGLQIMGPLETRALDFENIIILSVNEGVLPSSDTAPSFIPYNIRKGYGLPNHEFQDAVSAYNFYRSIFRAKRVYLLYDSRTEGLRSGEPSRFVMQLKYHYRVPLDETAVTYGIRRLQVEDSPVEKSDAIMDKIKGKYFVPDGKGRLGAFSSSSVNMYLNCGMRFYYSQIEGLSEPEDVSVDMDSPLFGTIFHTAVHKLYEGFGYGRVDGNMLGSVGEEGIRRYVDDAFRTNGMIDKIEGKNLINERLIADYVRILLDSDAKVLKDRRKDSFTLYSTEKYVETGVEAANPFGNGKVKLLGFIDRIDSFDPGVLRIVDYKTGKYAIKKVSADDVESLFDRSADSKGEPDYSFQLLFYILLVTGLSTIKPFGFDNIHSCLVPMRQVSKSLSDQSVLPEIGLDSDPELIAVFTKKLKETLGEIFDRNVPFRRTEVTSRCEYCAFRILCNR